MKNWIRGKNAIVVGFLFALLACFYFLRLREVSAPNSPIKHAISTETPHLGIRSASNQQPRRHVEPLSMPQLLIIGVQKCGTSALYFGLCLHPNVSCAAYVKEPFYLSLPISIQHLSRYNAWNNAETRRLYHQQYVQSCFNLSLIRPNSITLEASTTYFER